MRAGARQANRCRKMSRSDFQEKRRNLALGQATRGATLLRACGREAVLATEGLHAADAAAAFRAATSAERCRCTQKHHNTAISIVFMIKIGFSASNDHTFNTTAHRA
jgi:hypothetical protein